MHCIGICQSTLHSSTWTIPCYLCISQETIRNGNEADTVNHRWKCVTLSLYIHTSKLTIYLDTGLGYEAVRALCRSNKPYHIFVAGRSLQKAQDAIKNVQAEYPQTISTLEAIQVDLSDDASIEKAFQTVSSKHDHLDILINNGGESTPPSRNDRF